VLDEKIKFQFDFPQVEFAIGATVSVCACGQGIFSFP